MRPTSRENSALRRCALAAALGLALGCSGCGTTINRSVTDQLLMSDAIDGAIARIDFRDLRGQKVFLDTSYIPKNVAQKSPGIYLTSDYIVSGLRQQMAAAGCLMQEKLDEADFVVEARVGALGTEGLEVTYGIQSNNLLNTAASVVPGAPALPPIPEMSVGKRNDLMGAAKIAVYAYDRRTRAAVWQSGISQSASTAKDVWVLGVGPFQRGTIYDGTRFAGSQVEMPTWNDNRERNPRPGNVVAYDKEIHFDYIEPPSPDSPAARTADAPKPLPPTQ